MSDSPQTKTILITGCSSGIGQGVAHGLQARGFNVVASARQSADVERLRSEGLQAVQLDLADSTSIAEGLAHALEIGQGGLFGLFNNAAYAQPGAVEDLSRAALREQFETNLFGTQELTNAVIPVLRRQGRGRIIYNSSVLGLVALQYRGAYNASKFALEGLADTLRMELADTGIHVCLIEPGPIRSRFRANAYAAYQKNIAPEASPHREVYERIEARLRKSGDVAPFTLGPDAVLHKLVHALESPRPRPRYYVTLPTHLFGTLRRVLSTRALDRLLLRISRGENR